MTGIRVLSAEGPTTENSFTTNIKIKGEIEGTNTGTFCGAPRAGGAIYGEGQGVIMTKDGDMAPWSGVGVGRFIGPGKIGYRGSVIMQPSATGKLAFLSNVVLVFEFDVDETTGDIEGKTWEWK